MAAPFSQGAEAEAEKQIGRIVFHFIVPKRAERSPLFKPSCLPLDHSSTLQLRY